MLHFLPGFVPRIKNASAIFEVVANYQIEMAVAVEISERGAPVNHLSPPPTISRGCSYHLKEAALLCHAAFEREKRSVCDQ